MGDTKKKSVSTLLPTTVIETDFASSTPGSCLKPILAQAPSTDNDVLRSKVNAVAGGAVDPLQTRCFEFAIVREVLAALVDELSKPNVQRKLQKLLISSRKTQQPLRKSHTEVFYGTGLLHADGSEPMLAGRCALCGYAMEDVLARMDIPRTSRASVWKVIAQFAYDEEVMAALSTLEELLALPSRSALTTLLV